ncbi:MAG: hypothetical protein WAW72_10785 [Trichococcus flocculiformis]
MTALSGERPGRYIHIEPNHFSSTEQSKAATPAAPEATHVIASGALFCMKHLSR